MGNFYGQDMVTGDPIHSGDPVVAFVISQGKGHPFEKNTIQKSISSTGRYLLESLPLHGIYDGTFGIEINREKDLAVRLLLKTTDSLNWEDFQNRGLALSNEPEGVRLFGNAETVGPQTVVDDRMRSYGLTMMHASTFVHLLAQPMFDENEMPTTARQELEKMMALHARYASIDTKPQAGEGTFNDAQMQKIELDQVCSMGKQHSMRNEEGKLVSAPKLCRALDYNVYGQDFLASMRFFSLSSLHKSDEKRSKTAGALHIKGEAWPREDEREFLSQLWTVQATVDAMKSVMAEVRPVFAVTEGTNAEPIRAMRLQAVEKDLLRQFVRMVKDDEREPEEAMNFIDKNLNNLEEMVDRVKKLARAHLARNTLDSLSVGPKP